MAPISFNEVPAGVRVPWAYIEIDGSQASPIVATGPLRILVIGQKSPTGGNATVGQLQQYTGKKAAALFGPGSLLVPALETLWANNSSSEIQVMPIAAPAGATAAQRLITITPVAETPEDGTLHLLLGGRAIDVAVLATDDLAATRAKVVAAVNADPLALCTATNAAGAGDITFTAKDPGTVGNGIRITWNYYPEQAFPPHMTVNSAQTTGGSGNPDLAAEVFALLDDTQYHIVLHPWTETEVLGDLDTELAQRWGPSYQNDGHAISAGAQTFGQATTLGAGLNSKHLTVLGAFGIPNPPFEVAAALAGQVAFHGGNDPARPFQTLELNGILPPDPSLAFTAPERELLLNDGISTLRSAAGGKMQIERVITTQQTNENGEETLAFLDLNTVLTLSLLRSEFRSYFLSKFPRYKLGQDGKRYASGQAVLTPAVARAEAIAVYSGWESRALVENTEAFGEALIVEVNEQDPTRLDMRLQPNVINQLRVLGVQLQFLL